jgi:pimeloyl-ACP methyl ester carboxylesterase
MAKRSQILVLLMGLTSFAAWASPRSQLIEVAPNVRLHILEEGKASARPTLVLIPGWRLTANIWSRQIQSFGRDRRVIAIDPRSQGEPFAVQQLRLLPMLSDSPRDYTEGMMRAIHSKTLSDADLNRLVDDALKTPTATAEAMLIADLFGRDRTAAVPKFTVRTLIVASERSAELAQQDALAKQLPNAKIVVVANAGHAVFADQAERFESIVRDFLDHRSASAREGSGLTEERG